MTRIIAGRAKGRRLAVPSGSATRPTTDRVREAMFSTLESMLGPLAGLDVLDLWAGSGALGLEALSRGAASCTFVERDRRTGAVLRANIATSGLAGAVVVLGDVARVLAAPADRANDVVLADPPYDTPSPDVEDVLDRLVTHGWLAPDGVVVVERGAEVEQAPRVGGLEVVADRGYGQTRPWYLRGSGDHGRRDR
jgi:16S rRNA (guanine966-N2)-methyltransferase